MEQNKSKEDKWLGVGIFAAVTASLCCIAPVLAVLGGIGSITSTFSWLEPLRPYLIGISVIALGTSFYQSYKPKKEIECDCVPEEKSKFINSKKLLWIIFIVSVVLFSFPYYSGVFFPNVDNAVANLNSANIVEVKINIEGMTCTSCEYAVDYSLKTTDGVLSATSSYKTGIATVKYDNTKVNPKQLKKAIEEKVGYKVKEFKILEKL